MGKVKVGKISGVRGLKGEVKIKSYTNMQEERFLVGNKMYIEYDQKYVPVEILDYRVIKNADNLTFKDYLDINKISKFINCDIYMDDDYEINLDENEFFIDDIIGLKVFQGKTLKGHVKDVVAYPSGDYLVIETDEKDKLVPFRDEFILEQDQDKIVIIEMEGLI
jgi:16S rRNA processing protein RimM